MSQPDQVSDPADIPQRPWRVMVVERKPFLVVRLIALSAEYPDIHVVGAAAAGGAAVEMTLDLKPDVVLIEEDLPDTDAFQLCDRIRRQLPEVALILVSQTQTEGIHLLAVESGACGLISPLAPDEDLLLAVLRAAEGEFLLPRSLTLRLFQRERELRRRKLKKPPAPR